MILSDSPGLKSSRASAQRRENLQTSVVDLQSQLDTAAAALDLAEAELAHEQDRNEREFERRTHRRFDGLGSSP